MKKLTLILFVGLLASCNKEPIEKTSVTTTESTSECECGEITEIGYTFSDTATVEVVMYNECSHGDTTLTYIPQTNAGADKSIGDFHCLGQSW